MNQVFGSTTPQTLLCSWKERGGGCLLTIFACFLLLSLGVSTSGLILPATPQSASHVLEAKAKKESLLHVPASNSPATDKLSQAYAHFVAGLLARSEGDEERAFTEFFQAVMLDPVNEPLAADVAQYFLSIGKPKLALQVLTAVSSAGIINPVFKEMEALANLALGRTNRAITILYTLIRQHPAYLPGYLTLSSIAASKNDYRLAEKTLRTASSAFATNTLNSIQIAEAWVQYGRTVSNRWQIAIQSTKDVLNQIIYTNLDFQTALRLANLYAAIGQYQTAIDIYTELLGRPAIPNEYKDLFILRYLSMHQYVGKQTQLPTAIQQIRQFVGDNPSTLLKLAIVCNESTHPELAAQLLKEVLGTNPDLEAAYYELARAKMAMREPNAAIYVLENARRKFGATYGTEFLTGIAYTIQEDYTNALRFFTSAEIIATTTANGKTNELLCFYLGSAFERLGNYPQAERYLKIAIQLRPDFHEALNYLGYMWTELGTNLLQAKQLIEQALAIDPNHPPYLDSMGWVLFKLGRPKDALPYLQKAALLAPFVDPEIYDHLGEVYFSLRQYSKAASAWQRVLQVKDTPQIREKLARALKRLKPTKL